MSVTFGTPVIAHTTGTGTSFTTGSISVTSGQPIVLVLTLDPNTGTTAVPSPSFSDTFSSPYTWTEFVGEGSLQPGTASMWIGQGGAGASGTVTVSSLPSVSATAWYGYFIPLIGASTSSGSGAVDVSSSNRYTTGTSLATPSVTPTGAGEGAIAVCLATNGVSSGPGVPWTSGAIYGQFSDTIVATYPSPPSGSGLSTTFTTSFSGSAFTLIAVIKAYVAPPSTGNFLDLL